MLYRSCQTDNFDAAEGIEATLHVITNSFLSMGADKILAGAHGFINCPQDLLADERIELLPVSTTVIEILESVEPEPEVISACSRLKSLGYRLALDDFTGQPGYEALIDLADIIKVDFRSVEGDRRGTFVGGTGRTALTCWRKKLRRDGSFNKSSIWATTIFKAIFSLARSRSRAARSVDTGRTL